MYFLMVMKLPQELPLKILLYPLKKWVVIVVFESLALFKAAFA